MPFHVGDYTKEGSDYRGWLVGSFAAPGSRYTEDLEAKYWEYPVGPTDHPIKTSSTTECTFILEGECLAEIDGQKHNLKKGDYVLIQPGTANNLVSVIITECKGITIKAPSDVNSKTVINKENQ